VKNIKYFPQPSKDNQYIQNTINEIENAFETKVGIVSSLKNAIQNPKALFGNRRSDVFIINWLENNLRGSNNKLSTLGVFKYFIYLLYFRLTAKKIIYVRHNVYPHNMEGWHAKSASFITDIGEKLCHQKVAHSGHLIKEGYAYVPHPLYNLTLNNEHNPNLNNYYIMFGRIERYKKIETVINHWTLEEKLVIAGSVGSQSYLDELIGKAEGKNIKFDARFIPDDEAASLVKESNGVILAHADEDMIVSGSFFFAVTLGVPVFAIVKPFFSWLKNEQNFNDLYLFDKSEDIVSALKKQHSFDSNVIQTQANAFFGTIATAQAWKRVINDLSNHRR